MFRFKLCPLSCIIISKIFSWQSVQWSPVCWTRISFHKTWSKTENKKKHQKLLVSLKPKQFCPRETEQVKPRPPTLHLCSLSGLVTWPCHWCGFHWLIQQTQPKYTWWHPLLKKFQTWRCWKYFIFFYVQIIIGIFRSGLIRGKNYLPLKSKLVSIFTIKIYPSRPPRPGRYFIPDRGC